MPFYKLTNTTKNERRAIFTASEGFVVIEPGQSKVVEVSDADLKANTDYFKSEKSSEKAAREQEAEVPEDNFNPAPELEPAQDDAYAAMSDDALRDLIEDRDGKRPHHNTGRDKLLSLARGE